MKSIKSILSFVMVAVIIAAMAVTSFADGYDKTVINDGVLWKFEKSGSYWIITSVETGEYLTMVGNACTDAEVISEWDVYGNTIENKTSKTTVGPYLHCGSNGNYSIGDQTDLYLYQRKVEGNTVKYEKVDAPTDGEIYLIVGIKDAKYCALTNTWKGEKTSFSKCRMYNLEVTIDGNYARSLGATEDETIAVEDTEAATEAPATEAPATDAPATEAPATAAPTTTDSTTASQTSDVALVSGLGVLALSAAIVCLNKKRG